MKKESILIFFILSIVKQVTMGECQMTAIRSFSDCLMFCMKKYGVQADTQRKFYNRFKGECQKQVECIDTPHRVYENRCLGQFQESKIGDSSVNPKQQFSEVYYIVKHGNKNELNPQKMCYPGFKSSRKRIKIDTQVYQEYYCDLEIDQDPYNYPRSHSEYYFHRSPVSQQVQAVSESCKQQNFFTFFFFLILLFEVCFLGSVCHFHVTRHRLRIYSGK